MLNITRFIFNNFGENTFLAVDEATGEAAVIDPGMLSEREKEAFSRYIEDNHVKLTQIILTHAHLDHCFGANYVRTKYGIPVKAHAADEPLAKVLHLQTRSFGMQQAVSEGVEFDVRLKENDIISIGESRLRVIHVPGHSPGGIALYDERDGLAFVGDSIFAGSIGRTDLEGGDYKTLIDSLKTKILTLPYKTVLIPGHGEATTVASEKKTNPFLI